MVVSLLQKKGKAVAHHGSTQLMIGIVQPLHVLAAEIKVWIVLDRLAQASPFACGLQKLGLDFLRLLQQFLLDLSCACKTKSEATYKK